VRGPGTEKDRKRREALERQQRSLRIHPLREERRAVEERIAVMERRKRECETAMADPALYRNGGKAREVSTEYHELESALTAAYARWTEVVEELERLDAPEVRKEERR
jgi:ATP-binding cassette subfamily F protein 3